MIRQLDNQNWAQTPVELGLKPLLVTLSGYEESLKSTAPLKGEKAYAV